MKKFNLMTEKQMSKTKGGELVLLFMCILAFVVAPAGIAGCVGWGTYEGVKNNNNK